MHKSRILQSVLAAALLIGVTGATSANETHHLLPQQTGITTALGNNTSAVTY